MKPEQEASGRSEVYEKVFLPNHSILVNDNLGITITYNDGRPYVSTVDYETKDQKTGHIQSMLFNPLIINGLVITAQLDENNEPKIRVESDNHIQAVGYSYPQNFLKLFELRRQRAELKASLSLEDSPPLG